MSRLYHKVKVMPKISRKNQITLPVDSLAGAGLKPGDEVTIEADAPGVILVRRAARRLEDALGILDGVYEPGYLARLRGQDWP
jgi:bifunctional DNA-binding transcriptional regulator/antitoxin component of YhaV-PrlF toxin-antitoxin module